MENNLDRLCFKYGTEIAREKDDKNIIQKALGVVEEDGVFAIQVYLDSLNRSNVSKRIEENITKVLDEIFSLKKFDKTNLEELGKDIDKLFLAKELIERTLIYARYHAKGVE